MPWIVTDPPIPAAFGVNSMTLTCAEVFLNE